MRSLKTLFLKYVALNGNEIDEILSGLPLLESLSLIECYNLFKLNFVPPNLKYLKVVGRCCDSRLEISAPNITSLDISGSIEQVYLKNLCSLKDATLGFGYRCWGEDQFHEVRKTLDNLNHAKVVTIYEECILVVDTGFFGRELDVENYWNKHEESFQGLINNLRTVRIHGWVTHPDVPPLVQFLLKNSMGLEKMVITYKRSNDSNQESYFTSDKLLKRSQKLLKHSQKLLSFPRASSSAAILFS